MPHRELLHRLVSRAVLYQVEAGHQIFFDIEDSDFAKLCEIDRQREVQDLAPPGHGSPPGALEPLVEKMKILNGCSKV
jgi:hypothetical protein